jgi:hypothetical protein
MTENFQFETRGVHVVVGRSSFCALQYMQQQILLPMSKAGDGKQGYYPQKDGYMDLTDL